LPDKFTEHLFEGFGASDPAYALGSPKLAVLSSIDKAARFTAQKINAGSTKLRP
jgi:hypothetical protein